MATPHNAAARGDVAKAVLLPGDPLRARFIAENYLTDGTCYNTVRNMLGFTGLYRGQRVSVQGSGMGVPSIGIYSYELYHEYGAEVIIRVGSAGGLSDRVGLRDVVGAVSACTNSNFAFQYGLPGTLAPTCSYRLLKKADQAAEKLGMELKVGSVLTSDVFYDNSGRQMDWARMGCLAVEMEAAGLYMVAAEAGREALCICTISDMLTTGEKLSPEERETGFRRMMEIGLEALG